jgi:adenylate cyclase
VEALKPGQRLEFGQRVRIPLTHDNTHIITFFGPGRQTFKTYSFSDIYEDRVAGGLENKIFIVGSSAPGLFDLISAPLSKQYPAMEVHASLIRSFLTNTFVTRLSPWSDLLISLLAAMLIGTVAFAFKPILGALLAVVGSIAYGFVAINLFSESRLWVEMARPILTIMLSYAAVMAYRYMTEEKDRKFLQSTFKTYLSPEIIDHMYREKQFPKLGGEERVCTAYFTDIQSFSAFSEKLGSPTRLVELLNEYLTELTDILIARGGTLDKYEGDAILAFFGAPMPMADHAKQAVLTALDMQKKLGELRDKWSGEGEKWPKLVHNMRMRIGINSGPIVTGNMGSTMRMNYTMMGDAVNLAARLESGAKQYGVYSMISDVTYAEVKNLVEVRQVDKLQVVGKSEPVVVYELLCEAGGLDQSMRELVASYNEGLAMFYRREWDRAVELLVECEKKEPFRNCAPKGMSPSRNLRERCLECLKNPPGADWDGVTRLTSK